MESFTFLCAGYRERGVVYNVGFSWFQWFSSVVFVGSGNGKRQTSDNQGKGSALRRPRTQ